VIAGVFITPSFAGLLLVQTRLSALARETASAVNEGKAGGLVVELQIFNSRCPLMFYLVPGPARSRRGSLR
jgi:hypothetical protein